MTDSSATPAAFDAYAGDYDTALARGLAVSGEDKDYFARGRVAWLARCLDRLEVQPRWVMDYGCGTGSATPYLRAMLGRPKLLGLDISPRSLEVAERLHGSDDTRFLLFDSYLPNGSMDLVFCNGVFHHIPLAERARAVNYVLHSLRPGGLFALWENNPWNPGTRYVMSRIPFDRDAIPLSPRTAGRLLRLGGFEVLSTRFLFIFPRVLRWFRRLEPLVAALPCGAQYQVLCRKPATVA